MFRIIRISAYLLVLFVVILALMEFGLRKTGKYKTQTEKIHGEYISIYDYADNDIYHLYPANWTIVDSQAEFTYAFETNSIGLREREILPDTGDAYRILTIGDSFTHGDGAPYDSTYPRFLKSLLQERYPEKTVEVYNAGMNGSDLFYMFTLLRDKLQTYKPDLVLFLINESEPYDVIVRGGEERFVAGDTIAINNAPKIESYFERYHLVRFVAREWFGMDETMLTSRAFVEATKAAVTKLHRKQDSIKEFCDSLGYKCAFVSHVSPITMRKSYPHFKDFMANEDKASIVAAEQWKASWLLFDRPDMPELNSALAEMTKDSELIDYAWPLNEHFNGRGYELLAKAAIWELDRMDTCILSPYCSTD